MKLAFFYVSKNREKIPHRSDVLMQKINNDLRYLIQFLDARYNSLWLFPCQNKHRLISKTSISFPKKLALALVADSKGQGGGGRRPRR